MNKKVIKPLFLLSFAFCLAFLPPLTTFAEEDILGGSNEEILKDSNEEILNNCENAIDVWSDSKLRRYAEDNVLYYDDQFDCEKGSNEPEPEPENPCTPILQGNTTEEKIWNWIATAGIPGVSDNSAVIAGILGNLKAENSKYNPFYDDGSRRGLYQAMGDRYTQLGNSFTEAKIDQYWKSENVPEDIVDKGINITLKHLFYKDAPMQDFLKNLDKVSYTSGAAGAESYAELFLVAVEKAVGGSEMLQDPKVQSYANAMYKSNPKYQNSGYQGTNDRRTHAKTFYKIYASGTVPGTPSEECTPSEEPIVPGGSPKEAQEIIDLYREAAKERPKISDPAFVGCEIGDGGFIHGDCTYAGGFVNDGGCSKGTFNNCSAFSQWFVNKYWGANLKSNPGIGCGVQGSQIVDTLTSEKCGYGYTKSKTPRVGAIVSMGPYTGSSADGWPNHTGVVLGIDIENDLILIGEASCRGGFTTTIPTIPGINSVLRGDKSYVYKLSRWNNASNNSIYGPKYAYKEGFNLYGD